MQSPFVQLSFPSKLHPGRKEVHVALEVCAAVFANLALAHVLSIQTVVASEIDVSYVHYLVPLVPLNPWQAAVNPA